MVLPIAMNAAVHQIGHLISVVRHSAAGLLDMRGEVVGPNGIDQGCDWHHFGQTLKDLQCGCVSDMHALM